MSRPAVDEPCRCQHRRAGPLVVGVAAAVAVMAALPAVASAALTITANCGPATANCATTQLARTSGPPGARLIASINGPAANIANSRVSVTRAAGDTLNSIRFSYSAIDVPTPTTGVGRTGCVSASFTGSSLSLSNVNVNPALPRDPGTYNLSYVASPNPCTDAQAGTTSTALAMGQVTVTPRTPNPVKPFTCGGLRVALVLDESLSIAPGGGVDFTGTVREAALAFVEALSGTDTSVGIIPFSINARFPTTAQPLNGLDYTPVTGERVGTGFTGTIGTDFAPFINNTGRFNPGSPAVTGGWGFNPSRPSSSILGGTAGTNWDRAFRAVPQLDPGGPPPDLVVFVTDGDPNGTNATTSFTTDLDGGADIMNAAVASAAAVKGSPDAPRSRVFAVGVGAAVASEAGVSRLTAVSGPDRFTGQDFAHRDFEVAEQFADLKESLTGIVRALCGGHLVVTKTVFGADGAPHVAEGWRFSATLDPSPGHTWLNPASAGTGPTARQRTNAEGQAQFGWRLNPPVQADATVTLTVRERSRPGFHRVIAECEEHAPNGNGDVRVRQRQQRTTGVVGRVIVQRGGWATCTVENREDVAHLTIVKRLIPADDPGRFDLLVNGDPVLENVGDGEQRRLTRPVGNTYQVSERITTAQANQITLDQYEISTTCVNRRNDSTVVSATGQLPVSVHLAQAEDDIVCTITNRRPGAPPAEVQPPPGPPIIPPPPGTPAGVPSLVVVKRMPTRARVGDRVPIVITVRNVGAGTARVVRLFDTRPIGARIVRAGQGGSVRRDGSAVWRLGSLAPGATRTIRATALVTRTGLHTNTAAATASGVNPAFDVAGVRARSAPRPSFTG